ncbi:MAG: PHP domain-containing protein [Elusimicrobiales bacterium]|nr:PHP domain-containing protein [Elusimicrobiales bacterium]
MALINLHSHSTYSDGTLTPAALAREAARAGIGYFSLTDHDMTGGWAELEPALKDAGIKYCYGVEISTCLHENLHILGYGMNPADPVLAARLAEFRGRRVVRIKKILELLKGLGIEIAFEDLPVTGNRTVGRPHVADVMRARKLVPTRSQAFKRYLAPGAAAYVSPNGPSVEEAIRTIKDAGGKAVLAHPGVVSKVLDLPAWKDAGLDGIEAFYPAHTQAVIREFTSLAARHGLFVTAGSDFHGPGSERDKMTGFDYSKETFAGISELFI